MKNWQKIKKQGSKSQNLPKNTQKQSKNFL